MAESYTYTMQQLLQDWKEIQNTYTEDFDLDIERENGTIERVRCYLKDVQVDHSLGDDSATINLNIKFNFKKD